MTRSRKRLIGISLFAVLVVPLVLWPLLFLAGGPNADGVAETLAQVAFVLSVPLCIAHAIAGFYGFIWVIRNFTGRRQTWWILGFVFGGSIAAFAWWWLIVRQLPEPADEAMASA
jgi:hypothetical protein